MYPPWKTSTRVKSSIPPKVRWSLITFIFGIAALTFGMTALLKAIRGNEHWMFSAQDQGGGMTIWVRRSGAALPVYTVVVQGYSLGRNVTSLAIDGDGQRLPKGMTLTFVDTTVLPGRCTLQIGPLSLDVMKARLYADGHQCNPGGEITVQIASPPGVSHLK